MLKNVFLNKKYTFTICVGRVWIVIGYFLIVKQAFNGLLNVISVQKGFVNIKYKNVLKPSHRYVIS